MLSYQIKSLESMGDCSGGSWIGNLGVTWDVSVPTFAGSDIAETVITRISFVCWGRDGWPTYSPDRYFQIDLPTDPHWPKREGYIGFLADDENRHLQGFSNLTLT